MSRSREDTIIATLCDAVGVPASPVGPGDDGAVIHRGDDGARVITTDAMVEGVHFLRPHPPRWLGAKLLAANVSDVAAMGAVPEGFLVTAALPADVPARWWEEVSQGIASYAREVGATLVGGDTVQSPGPVVLSVTAWGRTDASNVLTRCGGHVGDVLMVHGPIGLSHAGWLAWRAKVGDVASWSTAHDDPATGLEERSLRAHLCPRPAIELGPWALRQGAHAGMDLSDGLFADVPRIARASGLRVCVDLDKLPPLPDGASLSAVDRAAGGEDHGLMVLVAPSAMATFEARGFVRLGHAIEPGDGVEFMLGGYQLEDQEPAFNHFDGLSS